MRVARGRGGAEVAADRAAVADLRRADRARRLGERGKQLGELRLHRLGVRQAGGEADGAVLARPALQLRDLGEVEDRLRPRPVEVELDEQVGAAGDRPRVGPLRLHAQGLVEGAGSDHLHAVKDTVLRDEVPARRRARADDGRRGDGARGRLDPRRGRLRRSGRDGGGAGGGRAHRARRRGRHARPRQHPPPPLPDPHSRARAAGDAVRMARRALPDLGPDRRRGRVRRGTHRDRRADALGLHDRLRPPLRLPARPHRARRGGGAGGDGARLPPRRLARLDGPRRLRRRPAAGRARRGDRRGAGRHGAARRRAARDRAGRANPDRGRAVLAVLRHRAADDGVGRARPPPGPAAAHAPRRDGRGGGVLQGAVRLHAGRVPRLARLARRRRLVRALRPPLRARDRALRRDGHRRRPLPDLEPPPRRRRRARARHARRRRAGRARRRRLGLERAQPPLQRRQAGAARRPWPRRPDCDDGARGDPARHARRRERARPRRTSARSRPASAPTSPSGRRTGSSSPAPPIRSPGSSSRAHDRVDRLYVGGELVVQGGALVRADEAEIARAHRAQASRFAQ